MTMVIPLPWEAKGRLPLVAGKGGNGHGHLHKSRSFGSRGRRAIIPKHSPTQDERGRLLFKEQRPRASRAPFTEEQG